MEFTDNYMFMLVGNKVDLVSDRAVKREFAEGKAREFSATYFETSALDGTNVEEAFTRLALQIIAHIDARRASVSYK